MGPNSGREMASTLVKRCKCPKDLKDTTLGTYHWSDFDIGQVITVYTRPLVVVDADSTTREFFAAQGRPLGDALPLGEAEPKPLVRQIPPSTGFGSEEDSLTSCMGSLVQNAPRKVPGPNKILRFLARFLTDKPEDKGREFVLSYFFTDRTISIQEPPKRNSGIVGGTFLSRLPAKQLSAGAELNETSFFVGATVTISGHLFTITDTDSATLDYMEENSESFPYSNVNLLMERAAKVLGDALEDGSFEKVCADATGGGASLSAEQFKWVMECFDLATPEQQCITLFRSLNEGGAVPIARLLAELRS